ncbi:hypothetical protein B0T14DRAFT_604530 [Immersiella caudata]|uniref:Uncharacterized protein n=1 Tax=Immersiella caudata TaxID=314043 RepID=A0AA39WIS0_9PEZI|nr:hypothetical protein B0T14DRAFT_604530 [Immersiella caudata]
METVDEDSGVPEQARQIALTGSYVRRFYFPLLLLSSLKKTFQKTQSLRMPDVETAPSNPFKSFVNKLGHICDSCKGGKTVTSFAILQHGTIQYYFTSNNRDEEDYQRTSHYVAGILEVLGKAQDDEIRGSISRLGSLPISLRLLRSIVEFNQSRIKGYIGRISETLDTCINSTRMDQTDDGKEMLCSLQYLKPILDSDIVDHKRGTMEAFIDGSIRAIKAIFRINTPSFKEYLRLRTHNNTDRTAPWVVLSHSIGRLLSYYYAINILLTARRNWPQLFVDFSITFFPSTTPRAINLPRNKLSANHIINNMTSDAEKRLLYQKYALELENSGFPLNTTISSTCNFKPFVHAEVNLLDHLLRLPDGPPQFFLNDRYIGTSKPTCRLCECYFMFHPSGVQVREGHKNLYIPWRTPDVYDKTKAQGRNKILDQIIPVVREEVFLNLREKFSSQRPNDSWDTPSNVPPEMQGSVYGGSVYGGSVSVGRRAVTDFGSVSGRREVDTMSMWGEVGDELAAQMGMVSIHEGEDDKEEGEGLVWEETPRVARRERDDGSVRESLTQTPELTEGSTGEEDDGDDNEGGGALL